MTNYPPLTQVAHSLVTQVALSLVTQVAHSLVTQVGNLLGGGVGNPVTKIHYTLVKPFCGSNHRSTVKGEGDTKPVTQVAHSLVTQVGNLLGGGVGNHVTTIHYTLVKPFCRSYLLSTVKGDGDTKPVTQVAYSLVTQVGNLLGGGVGNPVTKIHTIHIQGLK